MGSVWPPCRQGGSSVRGQAQEALQKLPEFVWLSTYCSNEDWLSFAAKEVRILHAVLRGVKLYLNKGELSI